LRERDNVPNPYKATGETMGYLPYCLLLQTEEDTLNILKYEFSVTNV